MQRRYTVPSTEVAWKVSADEVKARGYNLDFKNPHTVEDDHGDPAELLAKLEEAERQNRRPSRPAQGDPDGGAVAMKKKAKPTSRSVVKASNELAFYADLLGEIKTHIRQAQTRAALAANAEMVR